MEKSPGLFRGPAIISMVYDPQTDIVGFNVLSKPLPIVKAGESPQKPMLVGICYEPRQAIWLRQAGMVEDLLLRVNAIVAGKDLPAIMGAATELVSIFGEFEAVLANIDRSAEILRTQREVEIDKLKKHLSMLAMQHEQQQAGTQPAPSNVVNLDDHRE